MCVLGFLPVGFETVGCCWRFLPTRIIIKKGACFYRTEYQSHTHRGDFWQQIQRLTISVTYGYSFSTFLTLKSKVCDSGLGLVYLDLGKVGFSLDLDMGLVRLWTNWSWLDTCYRTSLGSCLSWPQTSCLWLKTFWTFLGTSRHFSVLTRNVFLTLDLFGNCWNVCLSVMVICTVVHDLGFARLYRKLVLKFDLGLDLRLVCLDIEIHLHVGFFFNHKKLELKLIFLYGPTQSVVSVNS